MTPTRRSVLVFAGLDPSGGAGISADIEAIGALGAHALPIITALTVQDNDRVFAVNPVATDVIRRQAQVLIDKISIAAVKIGIVGNHANAAAIAEIIMALRRKQPELPLVLDTVLASGHGDALTDDDPAQALRPLIGLATVIAPNLPEAARLCPGIEIQDAQAQHLLECGARHVLIKGGHGAVDSDVVNRWYTRGDGHAWTWQRLPGEFHGSGCTLASALAALLARGRPVRDAIGLAQHYTHQVLERSYAIADGQRIPLRQADWPQ